MYPVILADPPWRFEPWNRDTGSGRAAEVFYATQTTDWLCALPVREVAAEDCCLFLWACWPTLQDAFDLIRAWGFTYKTCALTWVKATKNAEPRMGLGYWTRANTEPCLLATRGKPKRQDKGVAQVITTWEEEALVSGLGEHSEKPEAQYERIERLVAGPYLELFHRPRNGLFPPREGWTFLGNETTGRDMTDDLRLLSRQSTATERRIVER